MMKRFFLLLIATYGLSVYAQSVDFEAARNIAEQKLGKKVVAQQNTKKRVAGKSGSATQQPAFYVFNATDGKGFALISSEDQQSPLLGYSLMDTLPNTEALPDALKALLNAYEQYVMAVRKKQITPAKSPENPFASRSGAGADPLITTEWGQGEPYNYMCPLINEQRTITGCVATALGQILYYWKWPAKGQGYASGTTTEGETVQGSLENEYNWDAMKNTTTENMASDEASAAVSQLLYDCGLAVGMEWGVDGSGAHSPIKALYQNFSYIPTALRTYMRDGFESDEEYLTIIADEIDAGRPVYQSGTDASSGGHAYIIDGYNEEGFVHVNWGWEGSANAYYDIAKMNPLKYSYIDDQQIVVGIEPAKNGETGVPLAKLYMGKGLSTTREIGEKLRYTSLDFDILLGSLHNNNGEAHTWTVGAGMFDENNELVEVVTAGRNGTKSYALNPAYYVPAGVTLTCKLSQKSYTNGVYAIRVIYKEDGDEWLLPDAAGGIKGNGIYIKLEGKYITFINAADFDAGYTPVDNVSQSANNSVIRYYDVLGREVPASTKGLLIRQQGNEVKKVLVK